MNNTTSNFTSDVEENDAKDLLLDTSIYIFLALSGLSFGVGLVGNIAVVIQNVCSERFRSKANYFITGLAVSGILFLLLCGPITVLGNLVYFEWIIGSFVCSLTGFIQTASALQTSFSLLASTIDRYLAIRRPLQHRPSSAKVCGIFVGLWTASFVLPIPMAFFSKVILFNDTTLCMEAWPRTGYRHMFLKACLAVTYVLPLIIFMSICCHISIILNKKPPGEECKQMISRRSNIKNKTIRVFLVTFGAYYVCWLPKHIFTVIGDADPSIYGIKSVRVFWLAAQWLTLSYPAITAVVIHIKRSTFPSWLTTSTCKMSDNENSFVHFQEPFQRNRIMTNEFDIELV